ncbi:MAG TPA: hypothetical protein VFO24_04805 [Usitatibacter sp.]|nr:hypothetical protein [Usitatibacter sp.]
MSGGLGTRRRGGILAALAICTATAAFAADGDADRRSPRDAYREGYQRGYEDGFEKGYQKAMDEARAALPPAAAAPPRPTGPIAVSGAVYGTSSKNCDATRYVARRANGKRTYSFEVTNDMCGDPAHGDRKSLDVTYICGAMAKTATANEHRTIYLDCSP